MLLSTSGVRLVTSSSRLLLLRHSPRLLSSSDSSVHDRISGLVKESPVVVFMKGVPEQPRCGFSNAVVQILRMHDVQFKAHDVLQDEDIRQGESKEMACCPTQRRSRVFRFLIKCDLYDGILTTLIRGRRGGNFPPDSPKTTPPPWGKALCTDAHTPGCRRRPNIGKKFKTH